MKGIADQAITAVNNSVENRMVTVGTVDDDQQELNAEANLTFDGSTLALTGDQTISGNLTVSGTTTSVQTTNTVIKDQLIELGNGRTGTASGDAGLIVERGSEDNAAFVYDESENVWRACTTTATGASTGDLSLTDAPLRAAAITSGGTVTAVSLDISGDVDVDGTLEADAITVNGAALAASALTDTTNASNISSGTLPAARNAAAQTTIESVTNAALVLGRDADNQIKFATDDQITFRVSGTDGVVMKASGEIEATSLDISGDVDVDGTLEADAITVNGAALAASATTDTTNASNIASGTLAAARMDATQTAITSVTNTALVVGRDADNQIKFGADNEITFRVSGNDGVVMKASGEIEAASLDISGDVDVDGTLEADAITVNGAALAASATTDATNASNIGSGTLASARMAADQTAIASLKNTSLVIGRDADNLLDFGTDNEIKVRVDGADLLSVTGANTLPNVSATATAGTNQNGKSLTIGGGLGTGTGLPGSVEIASGIPTSSGTNAHTATPVAIFDAFGVTSNFGGISSLANDTGIGEIVYFGTEHPNDDLAAGRLVYLASDGNWRYADADAEVSTSSLIGIALGDSIGAGILLKGFFKLNSYIEGSFAAGAPCYVSEVASEIDFTAPSAAGDFVRIVGYGTATTNVIYFNPSSTFIEL